MTLECSFAPALAFHSVQEMEPRRRASIQLLAQANLATLAPAGAGAPANAASSKQRAEGGEAALDPEQRAELAYLQLEDEWRAKLGLPPRPAPEAPASSRSSSSKRLSASPSKTVTAK